MQQLGGAPCAGAMSHFIRAAGGRSPIVMKGAGIEVIGVLATGSMPEELAAKTRAVTEMWAPIIKAANTRGE
jgi:hypothetical protein